MATINQATKLIVSWRGYSESNGKADKFIIQPWNRATGCHATAKKNPWCAITVASDLLQIKAKGYSKSSTCKGQKDYFKKHSRWIAKGKKPRRGDVIFVTGHEGIITCVRNNGTGVYYSGNTGAKTDRVAPASFNWKTGKSGKKAIQGYGRPSYTTK